MDIVELIFKYNKLHDDHKQDELGHVYYEMAKDIEALGATLVQNHQDRSHRHQLLNKIEQVLEEEGVL